MFAVHCIRVGVKVAFANMLSLLVFYSHADIRPESQNNVKNLIIKHYVTEDSRSTSNILTTLHTHGTVTIHTEAINEKLFRLGILCLVLSS